MRTKRKSLKRTLGMMILSILYGILLFGCQGKISNRMGPWRVEIRPAGNSHYFTSESENKGILPSQKILDIVEMLSPDDFSLEEWEQIDTDMYFMKMKRNHETYEFTISTDGKIYQIEYENDSTGMSEEPDELVIKGMKQEIPTDEIPEKMRRVLSQIYPDIPVTQTWKASTFSGLRYCIVVGDMVFYGRPDGQIQTAGLIENGALYEMELIEYDKRDEKKVIEDTRMLLEDYRDRFQISNQVERLKANEDTTTKKYRFIVMGDSRANPGLWDLMIKHINGLDPRPDFIIHSGDLVQRGYAVELLNDFIRQLAETELPVFVCPGNHEEGFQKKFLEYRYLFGEKSLNYYFDYQGIRFILFDNVTDIGSSDVKLDWLEKILKETPDHLQRIVTAHKPLRNIAKWTYHSWNMNPSVRFTSLMNQYNVLHVFLGHIHAYSTETFEGVDYTVAGGGGGPTHYRFGPKGGVHHYLICDLSDTGDLEQKIVLFYYDGNLSE